MWQAVEGSGSWQDYSFSWCALLYILPTKPHLSSVNCEQCIESSWNQFTCFMVLPMRQEGMAISWRHKPYSTPAFSELDWSILLDAGTTITLSHWNYFSPAQKWEKIWRTRNITTTLVCRGKETHERYLAKVSSAEKQLNRAKLISCTECSPRIEHFRSLYGLHNALFSSYPLAMENGIPLVPYMVHSSNWGQLTYHSTLRFSLPLIFLDDDVFPHKFLGIN